MTSAEWTDVGRLAERAGELLRLNGATVSVAEGSAGGLISAALLSVPGAPAYFVGGVVVYTGAAHRAFIAGTIDPPAGMRGATEPFARYLAEAVAARTGTTWGIGEAGAAGPPNRYGDPAGHVWLAVAGPVTFTRHLLTGSDDRVTNMVAFAQAALTLFIDTVESAR